MRGSDGEKELGRWGAGSWSERKRQPLTSVDQTTPGWVEARLRRRGQQLEEGRTKRHPRGSSLHDICCVLRRGWSGRVLELVMMVTLDALKPEGLM
jgi:hypothetical protein